MIEDTVEKIRKDAIVEIKDKVKKNPKYLHPMNKERQEDTKRLKFVNGYDFTCWMQSNGIMISPNEAILKRLMCKSWIEYKDKCAQDLGLKDDAERQRERRHDKGINFPMEDNEYCSSNFGIENGEKKLFKRFLEEIIFENVIGSGKASHDGGIDFYCKNPRQKFISKYPRFRLERNKEYTIQLEMRCLRNNNGSYQWVFRVDYNNKPDFYILVAWDDRKNLAPLHIWMFHRDDMIRKGRSYTIREKFWQRSSISIANNANIARFVKHELVAEIYKLKEIIKELEYYQKKIE